MTAPAFAIIPIALGNIPPPAQRPPSDPDVLSPSQIETFTSCFRKGAFKYVYGYPDPPRGSTLLGSAVHTVLEKWLGNAIAPDPTTREGAVAQHALHLLPAPSPDLRIEGHFVVAHEGIKYQGYKDLGFNDPDGTPVVHDHKTTSDFKWAKDSDILSTDNQAIIYSYDELTKSKADRVRLQWLYMTTGKSRASRLYPSVQDIRGRWEYAPFYLTRDHVEKQMVEISTHGKEILESKRHFLPIAKECRAEGLDPKEKIDITNFRYDVRACDSYGGCPYSDVCPRSDGERAFSFMVQNEGEIMSTKHDELMARIQNKIAAQKAQIAPTAVLHENPRTAPTTPPPPVSLREKLQVPPPFVGVMPPVDEDEDVVDVDPVDVQPPPALPNQHRPTTPPAPTGGHVLPVKRGRGRPRKDSYAPPVGVLPAQVPAAPVATTETGYTLCIDCAPVSESYVDFSTIFQAVHENIRQTYKVTHYKIGEPGAYGKAAGLLVIALELFLEANPFDSSTTICVNTRTTEGAEALNTLIAAAGRVFRGN